MTITRLPICETETVLAYEPWINSRAACCAAGCGAPALTASQFRPISASSSSAGRGIWRLMMACQTSLTKIKVSKSSKKDPRLFVFLLLMLLQPFHETWQPFVGLQNFHRGGSFFQCEQRFPL